MTEFQKWSEEIVNLEHKLAPLNTQVWELQKRLDHAQHKRRSTFHTLYPETS